jgi:cyclase
LWLPERRILLAADAVEDPITLVAEPDRVRVHLRELDRLEALRPEVILPAHGDPDVIAAGGYGVGVIEATRVYLRALLAGDRRPLDEVLAGPLRDGWIHPHPPYERVHEHNLEAVASAAPASDSEDRD